MSGKAIKLRRKVTRRIGWSIIVLTVASAIMLASVIWLVFGIDERQNAQAQSVREDAVWAAYQVDRETSRLIEAAMHAKVDSTVDELLLRFDLLYSRIGLLGGGSYAIVFGAGSDVGDSARAVSDQVLALTPELDALATNPEQLATRIDAIIAAATELRSATGSLIVAANAAVGEIRVNEREATMQAYAHIGLAMAALTIGLILTVVMLALQLAHLSRNGREVELLSQKNARAARAARAASEAKSIFLTTMSHEIRTPLNGIIGMADVLADTPLDTEQAEQVGVIRQSGDMLLDLINDVLDFSKLEAGAIQSQPPHFALAEVMEFVRNMMAPRAKAAQLQFSFSYPDVTLTADPAKLRQVLVNLVGNALKFTEHGAVSIVATIADGVLRCRVEDTGPGIAAGDVRHLFKQFSQLDSFSTRVHGGSGLGLAICRGLVEAVGGQISVDSTPGHGSNFWFTLPVSAVEAHEQQPDLAAMPLETLPGLSPSRREPAARTGRVLIVDDNAINRQVAGALVKKMGLQPVYAHNGEEAIDAIAMGGLDLVLMDMQMPVLDGVTATSHARALGFNVPIVGLTANAMTEDRQACARVGMDDFIAKPVTRAKLEATLSPLRHQLENRPLDLTPSDIDQDYQKTLIEELGPDSFRQLEVQFKTDAVHLVDRAIVALGQSDEFALKSALHTLKGAALALGYSAIAARADDLGAGPLDREQLETLRRDAA
ncbi:hybrid sensor histidine kinase/response regulator [Devosia neptuniae]|jgi:signal transduction histidine kinase/DNA-binding response OmpR family regulator|uniref:hybrid sensor histidine kinase/response regulator n=1 Tax=Devosia neptuniae TaxID=191302 RepID=UPI0022AECA47|nr:ATP-binding protein [Devosia neptuniae]MCZ4344857.1 ATP-binding protein [Devosia neptuniae]|tara:strand:- start:19803 stop:21953 length:2151 start_codon:yes stop_codon:yes gene_type:complete